MGATHTNYRILIIDDSPETRHTIATQLHAAGFPSVSAKSGVEGLQLMRQGSPDLILMDLDLPDQDGLEFCQTIREESQVPIIILSARAGEQDKIDALRSGADDYLTKPASVRELSARMEAVLRRTHGEHLRSGAPKKRSLENRESVLRVGNVSLELTTCRASVNDVVKTLTPNEFRLMAIFMRTPGEVFTREDLRRKVWPDDQHSLHLVEVHIANLRTKIEPDPHHPRYILTVRSRGYKFAAP